MDKLKSNKGETLIESLVALLVVAMAIAFLSTAVVTATDLNKRVRNNTNAFKYDGASVADAKAQVNIVGTTVTKTASSEVTVYAYGDHNYYEGNDIITTEATT